MCSSLSSIPCQCDSETWSQVPLQSQEPRSTEIYKDSETPAPPTPTPNCEARCRPGTDSDSVPGGALAVCRVSIPRIPWMMDHWIIDGLLDYYRIIIGLLLVDG